MCGISGFFNLSLKDIDASVLDKMGQTITHRGPDNFSTLHKGYTGFAHNRLSLLDLSSNGNQPFANERYILVYNGEIYNFQDLRKELEPYNISYVSTSDTEVLFYYLIYKGIDKTVEALQGMFAFGFMDLEEKRLLIARDRVGIKPLFYTEHESTVYFASEMKAIHAAVSLQSDDILSIASVLGVLEKSKSHTAFKDLYHVSPGTYVSFEPGKQKRTETYFQYSSLVEESYYRELDNSKPEEIVDQFEHLLDESIKRMLVSDAKMGIYASGGVDSNLLSALAKKHLPDISLFTANVIGRFTEYPDAVFLSEHLGLKLHDYKFHPEMFLRDLVKVTYHYESPVIVHSNAVPFSNVSALTREHGVKAVLTGEGSDELFLGYPRLMFNRYSPFLRFPITAMEKAYGLVPKLKNRLFNVNDNALMSSLELQFQRYERQLTRDKEIEAYNFLPKKQRMDQYMSIQMLNEGILSLLWRNDRMGMISSIEARFPFLDESVIKFALNLPTKFKIRRTSRFHDPLHPFLIDKYVVRKALQRHVPDRLVFKHKKGFPLYGLNYLHLKPEYFKGGFWAELLKLGDKEVDYLVANTPRYILGKFVTVDIWGRLFIRNESVSDVEKHLRTFAEIKA